MHAAERQQEQFLYIPLNKIRLNPDNARKFDPDNPRHVEKLHELAESLRGPGGLIEPVVVRPLENGDFILIAGERRYRASCLNAERAAMSLEQAVIAAMVRRVDEQTAWDMMMAENLAREDLSPLEQAHAFDAYLKRHGASRDSVEELARRQGIDAREIRRKLALLILPQEVLAAWEREDLTQGHLEQLTRLQDSTEVLKAFSDCLRARMTVAELRAHIQASAPALQIARFDRGECRSCASNTSTVRSLFADDHQEPDGRCLTPACFRGKQEAVFRGNWDQVKARLGTNDFRFAEDLIAAEREIIAHEPQARCLDCPKFATVLRLSGQSVPGQERVCTGPRKCFEELYVAKPAATQTKKADKARAGAVATEDSDAGAPAASPEPSAEPRSSEPEAAERTGAPDPKRAAKRGEEVREAFYKQALVQAVRDSSPHMTHCVRLYVVTLALSSHTTFNAIKTLLGMDSMSLSEAGRRELVGKVLAYEPKDLLGLLREMALALLMESDQHSVPPSVRHLMAQMFEVNLAGEFTLTEDYLHKLTKAEIIRIGEEPQVDLWNDEQVMAYREQHYSGKALMSLKKGELIDLIVKSGANLKGRTPLEITTLAQAG